ncbi:hypothetical protein [Acetobacter nitrogenifigens]
MTGDNDLRTDTENREPRTQNYAKIPPLLAACVADVTLRPDVAVVHRRAQETSDHPLVTASQNEESYTPSKVIFRILITNTKDTCFVFAT